MTTEKLWSTYLDNVKQGSTLKQQLEHAIDRQRMATTVQTEGVYPQLFHSSRAMPYNNMKLL